MREGRDVSVVDDSQWSHPNVCVHPYVTTKITSSNNTLLSFFGLYCPRISRPPPPSSLSLWPLLPALLRPSRRARRPRRRYRVVPPGAWASLPPPGSTHVRSRDGGCHGDTLVSPTRHVRDRLRVQIAPWAYLVRDGRTSRGVWPRTDGPGGDALREGGRETAPKPKMLPLTLLKAAQGHPMVSATGGIDRTGGFGSDEDHSRIICGDRTTDLNYAFSWSRTHAADRT